MNLDIFKTFKNNIIVNGKIKRKIFKVTKIYIANGNIIYFNSITEDGIYFTSNIEVLIDLYVEQFRYTNKEIESLMLLYC